MNNNELRIGNLLRDKVSKTELKVVEISEENIVTYVIDRSKYPLSQGWGVEPIPLTEEILLKCGFEFIFGINNRYLKDYGAFYFTIMIMNDDKSYQVSLSNHEKKEGESIPTVGLGIIKYVHQLQNLYFALTGEELKINL